MIAHRVEPSADACFASMDLLAAPDEANDHGPVGMTVHAPDQELRLRLREPAPALAAPHEVRGLLAIPCALSLIEDHDVVVWRSTLVAQSVVAEVVDILNEGLHSLCDVALSRSSPGLARTCQLVTD